MLKIPLAAILLFFTLSISAQRPEDGNPSNKIPASGKGKIIGLVGDSALGDPVPYVTISLNNAGTNTPVNGTVAEENGKFSITGVAQGDYVLVLSFLGYRTKTIDNIHISDKKELIDLGTIKLSQAVLDLKEVTVTGQRALIEEKVDRTVYNAENDATNRGGDATDVLKKVPMLSVDLDGNVTMRGSQNVRVLINNKPSSIAANSISDALKQIPADMIKSVEVITSPSAKYDAEGSAGIINIVTKKNTLEGFSLNVDGSGGIRGSSIGLNGSYRKGKTGLSLGGRGRLGYNIPGSFINNQITRNDTITTQTLQTAQTHNNMAFGQYNLGWDRDLNKNNTLSGSVKYSLRNNNTYQNKLSTHIMSPTIDTTNLRDVYTQDHSGTWDVDINYAHVSPKVPQREFNLLALFSRNDRNYDFYNNILSESDNSVIKRLKNNNQSHNQEITFQADYQTPLSKNQLVEIGAKNILRNVQSSYKYYGTSSGGNDFTPLHGDSLSNIFNYNQNITAGYLSYTLNLPKSYTVKAGGRSEFTNISAHYQDNKNINIPSYFIIVPSINISKKLANGGTVKTSFNRRIQRPSLQFLNPNLQASNPINATIGNPNLRPEFTNNYELAYSGFKSSISYTIAGFMRNTTGSIQSIRQTKGDTILTTYQNIGKQDAYGINLYLNINISNKFSLNGGPDIFYAVLKNNVADPLYNAHNQGWVASYRLTGSYNFDKGWGIQLFGFYRGRQVQLQGYQGGFGIYSLSVKKDFSKQGSIGFGAENFFTPSFHIPTVINSPVLSQTSTNVLHTMNFKINFTYKIGKFNSDKKATRRKSIDNDDMKQEGDNGPTQGAGGPGNAAPGGSPAVNPGQKVNENGGRNLSK